MSLRWGRLAAGRHPAVFRRATVAAGAAPARAHSRVPCDPFPGRPLLAGSLQQGAAPREPPVFRCGVRASGPGPLRSVAQLGSATALGAEGRGFESSRSDQFFETRSLHDALGQRSSLWERESAGSNPASGFGGCSLVVERLQMLSTFHRHGVPIRGTPCFGFHRVAGSIPVPGPQGTWVAQLVEQMTLRGCRGPFIVPHAIFTTPSAGVHLAMIDLPRLPSSSWSPSETPCVGLHLRIELGANRARWFEPT